MIEPVYGEPEFRAEAKERLPDVAEALDSYAGLLHPIGGELAAAGRDATASSDFGFLGRLFTFVASVESRSDAASEIGDAIALSLLEPSDFNGPEGRVAWTLLPDQLRSLLSEAVE